MASRPTTAFSFTSSLLPPFPPLRRHNLPFYPRRLLLSASLLSSQPTLHSDQQNPSVNSAQFFDAWAERDMRSLPSPDLEVIELEDLPEQWRRSKIAWLCKELPAHKHPTLVRVLNAQKKWINQDDVTYVVVHCIRIRENESAFRVYSWMYQQKWYRFNFALSTKLADFLGKDRKIKKCREIFDQIIKQGRVPSESTFHILIIAYISDGSIDDACVIYNQMIKFGGYKPRLSLHNALFKALVSKTGGESKLYLKQGEFIYHNLITRGLNVYRDIYEGLIWLHSYQDSIDKERIFYLREDMKRKGFRESVNVLVSIMRAFSKEGNVEETEKAYLELLEKSGNEIPSRAFVCRIELYGKINEPMKSLEIFQGMKELNIKPSISAYHKIINVLSRCKKVDLAETLMEEFISTEMRNLMPAFLDLMRMYLDLEMHEKLEGLFVKCVERCRPNRVLYTVYLDSLVRSNKIEKAEEIFKEMIENRTIGTNAKSCNIILKGYVKAGEFLKAEKLYYIMQQKKYEIEPNMFEKIKRGLVLNKKVKIEKKVSVKLDEEQREILIGLFLGGLEIESDEKNKNHIVRFTFNQDSEMHKALRINIHERFNEWLTLSDRSVNYENEVPYEFSTISHLYFNFFASQFRANGQNAVPKLIHRWLSPCVLAYWYMYGGFKHSSGDILLKLKGGNEKDVERIVMSLKEKSLVCKVKRKGRVFWIGLQGNNAESFLNLIGDYLLDFERKNDEFLGVEES
ncbi:hypothetical protein LUZ60_017010 [Juncus effusus]|nr:hypothetical protein LUZ60_017010 [Juncus effusus]